MRRHVFTRDASDILVRMAPAGYTDAEIIEHIRRRTGITYSRRTLVRERAARQLGNCYTALADRTNRLRMISAQAA